MYIRAEVLALRMGVKGPSRGAPLYAFSGNDLATVRFEELKPQTRDGRWCVMDPPG